MIVSGVSGTGKTTLARRLSTHFALPLVSKDMIKEELANVLGCADLLESIKLGRASIALMYRFAEAILKTHHSCIIESVFHPEISTQDLISLQDRCPFLALQIHCKAEIPIIVERWKQRLESGERHACHMDNVRIPDLINRLEQEQSQLELQPTPLIHGHLIELDTTNLETIDYEQLFSRIRNILPEMQ
jgi:predicted kinase